ncbi:aminoacyl-tRNA hydrolase [Candidatus Parcubacteria bacterium]|nr:aminoacyl-tRNA hydrolase [Candidatus Parcubacteria bacterium]
MYTIVGLRNPTPPYANTRHNAGALVVASFVETVGLPNFVPSSALVADMSEGTLSGTNVRVLLPNTFMNASGASVKKAVSDADSIIVVHDDLDIPIGAFKVSVGRGSGGHNGVESVVRSLGSQEFIRLRVGICPVSLFGNAHRPKGDRIADFVLKDFTKRERSRLEARMPDMVAALKMIVEEGVAKTMNAYNA